MKVVLKKFFGVFKRKIILVPLIAVSLVAVGAGIGALTINDQVVVETKPNQYNNDTSYLSKRGSSLMSETLGESTEVAGESTGTTSQSKPSPTVKPKKTPTSVKKVQICDSQKKAAFETQYYSKIDAENSTHATAQNSSEYQTDPVFASNEDSRHLNALNAINQAYQQQLDSINC